MDITHEQIISRSQDRPLHNECCVKEEKQKDKKNTVFSMNQYYI